MKKRVLAGVLATLMMLMPINAAAFDSGAVQNEASIIAEESEIRLQDADGKELSDDAVDATTEAAAEDSFTPEEDALSDDDAETVIDEDEALLDDSEDTPIEEQSGTVDNLQWKLDSNRVLTISGQGAMKNFTDSDNTPWKDFEYDIRKVVISEGVTSVGDNAFSWFNRIQSVEIGPDVKTIGISAFYKCSSLTSVSISDNVTTLGTSSFAFCGFTEFHFPEELVTIGDSAFWYCNRLKEAVIPGNVTTIESGAFSECDSLVKVSLPEGLTSIGYIAFEKCEKLKSITIPESVTTIGEQTFISCSELQSVVIKGKIEKLPDHIFEKCGNLSNVELPEGLKEIGSDCFYGCHSLRSLTIPSTVTTMGARVFYSCFNLAYLDLPQGLTSLNFETFAASGLISITIPDSLDWFPAYCFNGCSYLTSIYLPGTFDLVGDYAFKNCNNLADVYFYGSEEEWNSVTIGNYNEPLLNATMHFYSRTTSKCGDKAEWDFADGVLTISGSGEMYDFVFDDGEDGEITVPWWDIHTQVRKVVIKSGITSIGSCAFIHHYGLEEIHIPKTVKKVSQSAFYSSMLKDVYYRGTESDWEKITIGRENDPLKNATKHFPVPESDKAEIWKQFMSVDNGIYDKDLAYELGVFSEKAENSSDSGIRAAYTEMGLDNIMTGSKSGSRIYSDDFGYAIGSIDIGDDNVIVITARGTINGREALLDGTTGITKGNFFGYNSVDVSYQFEEIVWKALNSYLDKYPYLESGDQGLKIVVCGHSLGGAAANLVGARLDILLDRGEFLASIMSSSDVYTYTFGAIDSVSKYYYELEESLLSGPKVVKKESNYSVPLKNGFENIHNIYNEKDSFAPGSLKVQVINAAGAVLDVSTGNAFSLYGKFGHMHLFSHEYGSEFSTSTPNHDMPGYLNAIRESFISQCAMGDYVIHGVVACPVDIFILKDGEIVGRIWNNYRIEENDPDITLYTTNYTVKHFFLPKGNYDVEILSQGDTEMSCFLEDDFGKNVSYDNVDLIEWKSFLFKDVCSVEEGKTPQLYVLDDYGEISKKVMPDGEEKDLTPGGGEEEEEEESEYGDVLPEDVPASGIIPDGIWLGGVKDLTYDGKKQTQEFRVYDGTNLLVNKTDYTVSYKNNQKAYEIDDPANLTDADRKYAPQIILKMKGNYSGKESKFFSIKPLSIEDTQAFSVYMKKSGKTTKPALSWNGKELKLNQDYTADAGDGFVTFTGCGNFTGTRVLDTGEAAAGVKQVAMSKVKATAIPTQLYTGSAYTIDALKAKDNVTPLGFVLTYNNETLKKDVDYRVTKILNATAAGKATIVLEGLNNGGVPGALDSSFVGERRITFSIKAYPMTGNQIGIAASDGSSDLTAEFAKAGAKPKLRVMFGDRILKEGRDYALKYSGNTVYPARSAKVTITGKGNFSGSTAKGFTVTPKAFSESNGIHVIATDKPYAKKAGKFSTTVKVYDREGKLLKAGTDYEKKIGYYLNGIELTNTSHPQEGDVITVKVTGRGGYSADTIESTYRILPSGTSNDLSKATIKIKNQSYNKGKAVYITSQDQFTMAVIGKQNTPLTLSNDGGVTGDFEVVPGSYVKNKNKGTAQVTFRGVGKYSGLKTVKFSIGARSILDIWFGWF